MEVQLMDLPYRGAEDPVQHAAPRGWLRGCWAEAVELSGEVWGFWRQHPRALVGGLVVSLGLVGWLIWPNDWNWLRELDAGKRLAGDRPWYQLSALLGKYGDFTWWNLFLFLGLLAAARVRRCGTLRRLAVASILGAVFSGLAVNVIRFSAGRPRPFVRVADGFYGPGFDSDYHAFPSGHTATAWGAAMPLLVACPAAGVPVAVVAGSVAWARMRANKHHPSDIAVSVIAAGVFGLPLGLRVRRWRKTK